MIVLPGGAYLACSYREAEPVCLKYSSYGFNTFWLDYVIISGEKAHKGSFINLCGDNEKLMKELDIVNCVNEKSAPAFIWATSDDGCVTVKNSLLVASAYEEANLPFSFHIFGKGWHGLSVADKNEKKYNKTIYKCDIIIDNVLRSKLFNNDFWTDFY